MEDDGLPNPALDIQCSQVSGPGTMTFSSPNTESTAVTLSEQGTYTVQLSAYDALYTSYASVTIECPF